MYTLHIVVRRDTNYRAPAQERSKWHRMEYLSQNTNQKKVLRKGLTWALLQIELNMHMVASKLASLWTVYRKMKINFTKIGEKFSAERKRQCGLLCFSLLVTADCNRELDMN